MDFCNQSRFREEIAVPLSKDEASIHARLKRRAQTPRKMVRNTTVLSPLGHSRGGSSGLCYHDDRISGFKLADEDDQSAVYVCFTWLISCNLFNTCKLHKNALDVDLKGQKMLERLRAERQAKIDELKERTNYCTTQSTLQLIQRYDLDPAAKAAATTVLVSKLGSDSDMKVYMGDESNIYTSLGNNSDVDLVQSTGLRNRMPSHARSH